MAIILQNSNYNTAPLFTGLKPFCWYSADQLFGPNSTLPSNGATVNFWFDLSGNNNHLNVAFNTFPVFNTNVQNGLPGVNFSLSTSPAAGIGTNKVNVNILTTFHFFCAFNVITAAPGRNHYPLCPPSVSTPFNTTGTTLTLNTIRTPSGINTVNLSTTVPAGGQSVQYWQTSTQLGIIYMGSQTASTSSQPLISAVGMNLGSLVGNANSNFAGYVLEIIGYNQSLTSTPQQAQILTYLQNKWSLT